MSMPSTYVDSVVAVLADADPLKKYKTEMAKVKRMILDGVKDHVVCHVASRGIAKEMWDALATLSGIFRAAEDALRTEVEIYVDAEGRTCGSIPHKTKGDP